jgi:enoyl-CoA hydratase/3-hydroxyacyl-CoA dehydrogenase
MSRTIKKVAIVGAGTMGHGIAEVCAIHGYEVILIDVSNDILRGALEKIKWSLNELATKGLAKEPVDAVLNRVKPTTSYEQARDVDLVIEAVVENNGSQERGVQEVK